MFKRCIVASLVAGLALGAQSAVAGNLVFYPGHGWLPQPPFSSLTEARDSRSPSVIAGPTSSMAGSQPRQAVNPQTGASPRVTAPAPYDTPGGYFN